MKVKNIMFSGAMASILMMGGAYAETSAADTALATAGFVRGAYNTAVEKTISNINTVNNNAIVIQTSGKGDNAALTITVDESKFDAAGTAKDLVGELGKDAQGQDYATVKAYVDAKTSGIATAESLAELEQDVSANTTNITNLTATVNQNTAAISQNTTAIQTVDKTAQEAKTTAAGKQDALNGNQLDAVNSGITASKVTTVTDHIMNTGIHVTTADKAAWNAKQAALDTDQLAAVNSGITSGKVSTYDGYATTIAGKADQSALNTLSDTVSGHTTSIQTINGNLTADEATIAANTAAAAAADSKAVAAKGAADAAQDAADAAQSTADDNAAAIEAINDADNGILKQAQTYADGLNSAMDTRVDALETKTDENTTYSAGFGLDLDESTNTFSLGYAVTSTTFSASAGK
ncbi:MAG: hypothetical protein KBS86_03435 [Proteobacteria bacterium]|nr:hypothetical protein [Candidatus Enterousia scatequi]